MRRLGWFSDDRQDQKLQPFLPTRFRLRATHGCESLHVESVPVKEVFANDWRYFRQRRRAIAGWTVAIIIIVLAALWAFVRIASLSFGSDYPAGESNPVKFVSAS